MSNGQKKEGAPHAQTDRGNEALGSADQTARRKKTQHEKRAELHEVLKREIQREERQHRIKEGRATPEEIHTEAQAIEEDARSRSRQLQQSPA